jgi:hypothetical protein
VRWCPGCAAAHTRADGTAQGSTQTVQRLGLPPPPFLLAQEDGAVVEFGPAEAAAIGTSSRRNAFELAKFVQPILQRRTAELLAEYAVQSAPAQLAAARARIVNAAHSPADGRLDSAASALHHIISEAGQRHAQAAIYVQIGQRVGFLVNQHFLSQIRAAAGAQSVLPWLVPVSSPDPDSPAVTDSVRWFDAAAPPAGGLFGPSPGARVHETTDHGLFEAVAFIEITTPAW